MDADGEMATDQSSTVMTTAPVRPEIVQISNNRCAVSRRNPRVVGVANPIGKTRFAREKQKMEEKLGKLILTNEKNKEEEENIASSGSSISAAKVEEGFDKEELHSANQRKEDPDTYLAAPLLASRQRRVSTPLQHPLAVRREAARREAAEKRFLQISTASLERVKASLQRLEASLGVE